MRECLAMIGVLLMLHLCGRGQWGDAMTILNTMYEYRIDPHSVMVENEGELCSPARCTLGCCEVCMNNGYCVRAANIMNNFRLLEPDPNLWLLKHNAGDDKIRNVMCKHMFLGMVDEDISAALEFFHKVHVCQKNCGHPIDLKSGFNYLLVGLLNAQRKSEALTVYRKFLSAVGRVEDTTLRALLAVTVDSGDIQYAGTIWSCLRLRGTYFQPVGQANSFVQVKSFWLKEEMYMRLLNHFNQLAVKFTPETIYSADADQFTVHLFVQDENVTYDSSTPAMLKTNTLRKYAVDRVKNVLRYNFQPPVRFLPSHANHNTHVALMLNPEDVRQYLISALQY